MRLSRWLHHSSVRALVALATFGIAGVTPAQSWQPEKPIRVLIGFPAGTTADVIARVAGPKIAETLGQPWIIENRPGAGSSLAAEAVARAAPDGHTLLMATIANTINPSLYKLGFDFARDLTPVLKVAELPGLLVAHPGVPAQTLAQLVARARAQPDAFTFASSGNGTVTHLYGELFNLATGTTLTHVPYKGSSQAVTDLLAGRISLLFSPASTVIPHVKAGTLRALGAIGPQRSAALPEVPTFAEGGVPGFETSLWFGVLAPAGTPAPVIERHAQAIERVLALPEVRSQLAAQGIETAILRGTAFAAFIRQDIDKWARVVKAGNIKPD